ncbi:unnamed protein product [Coregonus sp. 'balchen']|nr:unnamed protein product [Coregonus sp. 'balchen']
MILTDNSIRLFERVVEQDRDRQQRQEAQVAPPMVQELEVQATWSSRWSPGESGQSLLPRERVLPRVLESPAQPLVLGLPLPAKPQSLIHSPRAAVQPSIHHRKTRQQPAQTLDHQLLQS